MNDTGKLVFDQGRALLLRPLSPLVALLRFFMQTGDFRGVDEVIAQLPSPIETGQARYDEPARLLAPHLDLLRGLEADGPLPPRIVDTEGRPLDPSAARGPWTTQQVLTRELEAINSLLCAPCRCTLCCVGPDAAMQQEFFEIPLAEGETAAFPSPRIDSLASRARTAMDEDELLVHGRPFFQRDHPLLVRWRGGWSLILPRGSACPNLAPASGRCRVYDQRPEVCRRPQIFAYVVEPLEADRHGPLFRVREALLAVIDCPYVRALRDEIAAFAAASELELILKQNKS